MVEDRFATRFQPVSTHAVIQSRGDLLISCKQRHRRRSNGGFFRRLIPGVTCDEDGGDALSRPLSLSLSLSLSLAHEWFSMAENGLLLPLQWRWMVFPGLPMVDGERGRKKGYSATTTKTNQCGKIILFSSPVPFLWFCSSCKPGSWVWV